MPPSPSPADLEREAFLADLLDLATQWAKKNNQPETQFIFLSFPLGAEGRGNCMTTVNLAETRKALLIFATQLNNDALVY